MAIDREKYMDADEVRQLRTVTEAKAIVDLKKGRNKGPLAWMLVDLALSTGLRVSEIVDLKIQDLDFKRGSMKVVRLKRKKKVRETMAIGKDLIGHLREYLEWDDRAKGPLSNKTRCDCVVRLNYFFAKSTYADHAFYRTIEART